MRSCDSDSENCSSCVLGWSNARLGDVVHHASNLRQQRFRIACRTQFHLQGQNSRQLREGEICYGTRKATHYLWIRRW